jgi:putative heme degradation protein
LALRTDALVSAWILQRGQAAESRRQLRLYDEDGRALALIGAAPGWRQTECPLWRTLVNALID